jgi:hypothetical protein
MTNKVVGLRLSDATVRYADALASHFGVSRSAIVSLAVALLWERLGWQVVAGGPDDVPAGGPGEVRGASWEQELESLLEAVEPRPLTERETQTLSLFQQAREAQDRADQEAEEVQALLRERGKQDRKKKKKRKR